MSKTTYKLVKGSVLVPSVGYHIECDGKLWDVWYDRNLRLWTGFAVTADGMQVATAQYDTDRDLLCRSMIECGWDHMAWN